MLEPFLNNHDLAHLKAGMEVAWREQNEVNNNLVNAETPGFQPKDTDFRSLLMPDQEGAAPTRGQGFDLYLEALQGPARFEFEKEMQRLSQANLENAAYTKLLTRRYQDLRTVIREGR
ncbi:MAG: hypothetical protein AB7S38_30145 [Vulcanimicrobiota bacterium]